VQNTNKSDLDKGIVLPIMEAFYTIQGEGYHTGTASYFIRIGGCDVGCHWCDVKESWNEKLHPAKATDTIVKDSLNYPAQTVIVTGGEPLMWNLDYLTIQLKKHHKQTHIETSGAYPLSGKWDWICLSPKKTKLPLKEIYLKADELKMIIYNKDDFKFAVEQAKYVSDNCLLYLQPEWSKKDKMTPLIIDFVMRNPRWKISLQTHKHLNIP
jgi:organic radical activating enzyme